MKNFSDFGYKGAIIVSMTEENVRISPDADVRCCEACTCESAHRSKPAE